jgi:YVTN family beta-propeller protein
LSPIGIAYDPSNGHLYVSGCYYPAGRCKGLVDIIDGTTNKILGNISLAETPYTVTVGNSTVTFLNRGNSSVTVISDKTNSVLATIPVGALPWASAYDPKDNYLLVANDGTGTVSVVSLDNYSVITTFPAGTHPTGIAFKDPVGQRHVYVVDNGISGIGEVQDIGWVRSPIYDLTNRGSSPVPGAESATYDPIGRALYVSAWNTADNNAPGSVYQFNTETPTFHNEPIVTAGAWPGALETAHSSPFVYVVNAHDNTVSGFPGLVFAPSTTSSSSSSSTATSSTSSSTTTIQTSSTSTSASTSVNTSTSTSASSGGAGGIPEFPYQILAVTGFAVLIGASYLMIRRRTFA